MHDVQKCGKELEMDECRNVELDVMTLCVQSFAVFNLWKDVFAVFYVRWLMARRVWVVVVVVVVLSCF